MEHYTWDHQEIVQAERGSRPNRQGKINTSKLMGLATASYCLGWALAQTSISPQAHRVVIFPTSLCGLFSLPFLFLFPLWVVRTSTMGHSSGMPEPSLTNLGDGRCPPDNHGGVFMFDDNFCTVICLNEKTACQLKVTKIIDTCQKNTTAILQMLGISYI